MLIAWIVMGWRVEELRLPSLEQRQCAVFRDEMLAERAPVRADCVREEIRLGFETYPPCAHGGGPLPGRKRV